MAREMEAASVLPVDGVDSLRAPQSVLEMIDDSLRFRDMEH
jgi:hypothetical protein